MNGRRSEMGFYIITPFTSFSLSLFPQTCSFLVKDTTNEGSSPPLKSRRPLKLSEAGRKKGGIHITF